MNIIDYYRAHLTHIFGEEKANRIITTSKIYSQENKETDQTEFEKQLNGVIFPIIGLYRAMLLEGFTEEEVSSFLKALWDIAPEELKKPSSPTSEE